MSADNGIFIVDHPRGYAVLHGFMSSMPYCLNEMFVAHSKGEKIEDFYLFVGKDAYAQATSKGYAMLRQHINDFMIVEYGLVDWRNEKRDYKPELHS